MSTVGVPGEVAVPVRGRTAIASRAYEQLITALAADALSVGARSLSVRVSDERGGLHITVTGPVRASGTPVLTRVGNARSSLATRTTELTGAQVQRVTVHVTNVQEEEGRAR